MRAPYKKAVIYCFYPDNGSSPPPLFPWRINIRNECLGKCFSFFTRTGNVVQPETLTVFEISNARFLENHVVTRAQTTHFSTLGNYIGSKI